MTRRGRKAQAASSTPAPGNTGDPERDAPLIDYFSATPAYFEAVGARLVQGRVFEPATGDGPAEAVIDAALARRFFPEGGAVGSSLVLGDALTVVGVVDRIRLYDVQSDDRGQVYLPLEADPAASLSWILRTSGDPRALAGPVRATVQELDPAQPVSDLRTLEAVVAESLGERRLSLLLVASFAAGALLLASLGVYGVVSNGVTRRRREVGVRVAMGAEPGGVLTLVLRQGLLLTMAGLVLGGLGAAATGRLLESMLYGVSPGDPVTLVAAAALLGGVALLAAWIPARRATRIDPVVARRGD